MKVDAVQLKDEKYISKKNNEKLKNIITRQQSETGQFSSLSEIDIENISSSMAEIDRATNSFGKTQSQFMDYVMTVSANSPYRNLRQILAEIERRRTALKENIFKLRKQSIKLAKKKDKLQKINNKYNIALLQVDIEQIEANISDIRLYIEGALKQIYGYVQAYNDIKTKYGILDNWDEKDFEIMEEEYHIKRAFEQGHADVMAIGRIQQGNHEYFKQLGINPQNALTDILTYINLVNKEIELQAEGGKSLYDLNIGIESFNKFLDNMALKYKNCSKIMLEIKGINTDGYYIKSLFLDKNI